MLLQVWTFRFPMLLSLRRIRLEDAHIYCVGSWANYGEFDSEIQMEPPMYRWNRSVC